jgi:hypothetical protein
MEEVIIPFQTAQGMTICGSFVDQEQDDHYVWIRRFQDEAERDRLYAAVYETDHWKNTIAPKIPEMMDQVIKVTRIQPTPNSSVI